MLRRLPVAPQSLSERIDLAGASSSSQESGIWEQLTDTIAVSTVRGFQLARANNVPILSITNSSFSSQQSLLAAGGYSSAQIQGIQNLLAQANDPNTTVFASTHPINLFGWTGITYLVRSTGGQSWTISGQNGTSEGGYRTEDFYYERAPVPVSQPSQRTMGDPVNVANGGVQEDVVDIALPNVGIPLTYARHYDSTLPGHPALGKGWYGSYSDKLTIVGSTIKWTNDHGQEIQFSQVGSSSHYQLDVANQVPGIELDKVTGGSVTYVL